MPHDKYIAYVPPPNAIKRIGKVHTWLYRATFGLIGSRLDGLDVLLLTTIGKKSGQARCVPMPYFRAGADYVLVASFGGSAQNPAWLGNLIAQPRVDVQVGRKRWVAHARIAQGAERDRLWADITYEHPRYLGYQTRTTRIIPIVVLEATS
jgi:F420H(2)-dependent quinone reductase